LCGEKESGNFKLSKKVGDKRYHYFLLCVPPTECRRGAPIRKKGRYKWGNPRQTGGRGKSIRDDPMPENLIGQDVPCGREEWLL